MPVSIEEGDEISRCIIYDRAFNENIHVNSHLWQFGASRADGTYHESAVLRSFAPRAADVHQIGCNIAAVQNERKKNPPPGRKRRYYCGFRTAPFCALPTSGEGFAIRITHAPEGDVEAHVDVELEIFLEDKHARANCRTEAGLALAEQFGEPVAHRCECDTHDDQHPLALWGPQCLIGGLRKEEADLLLEDGMLKFMSGRIEDAG